MSTRPTLEVADVIRAHGEELLASHGASLSAGQKRVLTALAKCRTAALGGHVEECLDCGHVRIAYNSCRNRHCPKCQGAKRAAWLEREAGYLLPVEYHHVVFTLPQALRPLALQNQAVVYGVLFQAAAQTLRELAADPRYLGAEIGVLAVLHTWGQTLQHHPHVHCVVTGGGLSCAADGQVQDAPHWVACRPGFFLPVRVLGRLFRGKFLAGLRQAHGAGRLRCHGQLAPLAAAAPFNAWLTPLYAADWVVYAKPPFGGPDQVLKYLARYTHRVAISNSRLEALADGAVTFRYKDYAQGGRQRAMTLAAAEFLRRFLLHVLPRGFVKIRHYGLLANRQRKQKLACCRLLLAALVAVLLLGQVGAAVRPTASGCERCGSPALRRREIAPADEVVVLTAEPACLDDTS